jgi:nucleoside-diphosphate-sugar epimerase
MERATGRRAQVLHRPMPGHLRRRHARCAGGVFAPRTSLAEGIERFVAWYRRCHAGAA